LDPSAEPTLAPSYSQAPVILKESSANNSNESTPVSILAVVGLIIGLLALILFGTLYYAYKIYYVDGKGSSNSNDGNAIPLQELLRTAGDTGADYSLPLFQAMPRISNVFKSTSSTTQQQQERNSIEIRVEDQYMTGIYNLGGDLSVEENPTKYARPTLSARPSESPAAAVAAVGGSSNGPISIMNLASGSNGVGGIGDGSSKAMNNNMNHDNENPLRSSQAGVRSSTIFTQFKLS